MMKLREKTEMNANQIAEIIAGSNFSNEELNTILAGYKAAVIVNRTRAKCQFRVGDSVSFTAKEGRKFFGKITKINPKNIVVKTEIATWRVSPNLLKKETV